MNTLEEPDNLERQPVAQLVRQAQQGDRLAFEELFQRYQRAVYATVFQRLSNHAEAQEVCQEVFIQALRKLDQLENPDCFGGWLRSIAGRMAINRAVRRGPVVATEPEKYEAHCVEHETPLVRMLAREREDQVHRGLNRLPEMDRDTLVAFYFRGQSLIEMSDQFQSPVGTIKRRLHVARKRLAKELQTLAPA